MKKLRLLLLPFGWIYGCITAIRNGLFNLGILKSYSIPGKSICVGNLSVGGTGKTPHVDLIAGHFIQHHKPIATLSRGYGRSTQGLREVTMDSKASEVGDEPLLYKSKYGNKIKVVVAEKRKEGVDYIRKNTSDDTVIVLDDAFQHRAVKAGLNILITEFSRLFVSDFHLPAGNLREWKIGKKRADVIIVSKCPELTQKEKSSIYQQLGFPATHIFFSHIDYGSLIGFGGQASPPVQNILLVTGIGNPTPLINYLESQAKVEHIRFKDHHAFTQKDIDEIHEKFDSFASRDKIIVTTEKDYVRIKDFAQVKSFEERWFYQPITTKIDEQEKFNLLLDEYVRHI